MVPTDRVTKIQKAIRINTTVSIYAIGDIQGCYDDLMLLLDSINFDQAHDKLWFTGDLVNRGPKSLETLRFIYGLGDNAQAVLGNHDLHLLATVFDHQRLGKNDTFEAILHAPDKDELLDWLRRLPLIHVDKELNVAMLHAGIHPDWDIDKAVALAGEVETVIRGDNHIEFYHHMYGDKPTNWSDELSSWQRLRSITNTLTRLRYCKNNGEASLGQKGAPGTQAAGLIPWFDIEHRASKNQRIIFGHWSTLVLAENMQYNNVYPLDTGCLWGGKLTAMKIDSEPFTYHAIDCPLANDPKKF